MADRIRDRIRPQQLPGEASALVVAPSTDTSSDARLATLLGRLFLALAGLTYGLVVLGALVRAHGAGLSCPDWPLCFGEVVPEFNFQIAFEWGHRALAGSIGLLFVGLSLLTLRRPLLRAALWRGLLIAAVLLAIQIVLGGLTVLQLLAYWTVTSHLVTGNAFALSLVLIGRRLQAIGDTESAASPTASGALRLAVTAAGLLLGVQIVLGGLVASNYAGLACPDWPACMNGEYFPTGSGIQGLHVLHRVVGYSAAIAIGIAGWLGRNHPGSRRWIGAAALLAVAQVLVGIANVLLRVPVEITGLHSALAAALVCSVGVSVREVWRREPEHAPPRPLPA